MEYDQLPIMRAGQHSLGWDDWGCSWAVMNTAVTHLPQGPGDKMKDMGLMVPQPTPRRWTKTDHDQVEALLQPVSYPSCVAVATCVMKWRRFAYHEKR